MDLFTTLVTILVGVLSIFLWRTMTFFKQTGIPHKKPWPIVGNMAPLIFRKKHFNQLTLDYYKRWPDAKYVGIYVFLEPVLIIRDVELIKQITVKHFDNFPDHQSFINEDADSLFAKSLFALKGSKWREVRNLLSPAFTASKMRHMSELMIPCAKEFADFVISRAKQGNQDFEMNDAFTKYTNDVIATCAFGVSVNSLKDPNNEFYVQGKKAVTFSFLATLKFFFARFSPGLTNWLKIQIFDEKVKNFFINLVKTTIEIREKEGINRPDMISLMMESRQKGDVKLELIDMTAQAFLFFFGGFDSSASLMTLAALALASNPEIQDKLLEEIDGEMKRTNGNATYDTVNAMPYLETVLNETLRYYPVTGFLDRTCVRSFELPPAVPGAKPFTLQPGMNLWIVANGIHEDPQHYDKPEVFDPNRFLNQKISTNSPIYLPFGIGPRTCIANRFAILESKFVLFYLLSRCKIVKSSKLKEPIEYSKSSRSAVEGGCWLKIIPRN